MKHFILLAIYCLILQHAHAQLDIAYTYYSEGDKAIIFSEDFNNPADTIWIHKGRPHYVKDGYYHYFSDSANFTANDFDIDLDSSRNFEIEFVAKTPNNYKDAGIMFWGRKGSTYIASYWYFHKYSGEFITCTVDSIDCNRIRIKHINTSNGFAKYTLRKIGRYLYFYVNEKQKLIILAPPLYGNKFGLGAGTNKPHEAEAIFDFVRVSYLNK